MAKTKTNQDLLRRLRANGLRKRTARLLAEATDGRRKPAKTVKRTLDDLTSLVGELEDRLSGGPARRKASAKKGVATRRLNAAKRSASAKKAARTRTRSR